MARQEMPIFTRTFDFLSWLLPVTNNFPKAPRHTLRWLTVGKLERIVGIVRLCERQLRD